MAVNNISYPIYPLSTRTEKDYITKMIPFFFCSVYVPSHVEMYVHVHKFQNRGRCVSLRLNKHDKANLLRELTSLIRRSETQSPLFGD